MNSIKLLFLFGLVCASFAFPTDNQQFLAKSLNQMIKNPNQSLCPENDPNCKNIIAAATNKPPICDPKTDSSCVCDVPEIPESCHHKTSSSSKGCDTRDPTCHCEDPSKPETCKRDVKEADEIEKWTKRMLYMILATMILSIVSLILILALLVFAVKTHNKLKHSKL